MGDIAIVGMAAHLPGAPDITDFWENLRDGVESIRRLSEAEALAAGTPAAILRDPNYVPAAAVLDGFDHFDADFFGFSPKEAAILDPQHRHFLEVCWEALENAGHPEFAGAVGVYAGCGMGSYFYFNLCSNPDLVADTGMFLLRHTGNDKDFLSTRVSHVFDLKGPSVNLQTACSTSLVAVHQAARALMAGDCDMALAGGVTIELPHGQGYVFREGEILSPDGHCHAFDHRAEGTVFGSGAGVVVLRRLEDALRDGDHIWAVVKGSAINNDGAAKAGYLAPSVEGQAKAIAAAHRDAGIMADTVDYIECHGTGTRLGDPIEVAAMAEAFGDAGCRIGSVKTNIGHTDTAAGVAGLIKVALGLKHGQIPPSLGYEAPNPAIADSAFRVNDALTDWPRRATPRRAGVNSLGVGGTNAHVVVEEAPTRAASGESDWPFQLLVVSGQSRAALDANAARLAAHLRAHPGQPLADVAWTLKQGRRPMAKRRVIVAETHAEAADLLEGADPRRVFTHDAMDAPEVVFMFPGGGAQYAGMARDLYETEPVFRDWMDRGLAILAPQLDYDIRAVWLDGEEELKRPSVQLPLIMITEYALAQLYLSWGVRPSALVGHSMGENAAACLAGVIGFEDCIGLVLIRGQLFDTVPAGGMLSVPMAEADLRPLLGDCDMASVNAPGLCVVSGSNDALDRLAARLDVDVQRIAIDIAAHSRMLEPILGRFGDYLRGIRLNAPTIPIISNRSGQPLTAAEAVDPDYWVAHLRGTVMFEACMRTLRAKDRVYLEVGPGRAMSSLAQANGAGAVISALRHPEQRMADDAWFIASIGRLWACGVAVDWSQIWGDAVRHRVPLPSYAFQRKAYFIAPGKAVEVEATPRRIDDIANWGWKPVWKPRAAECDDPEVQSWLIFADGCGVAAAAADNLRKAGHRVTMVRSGDTYARDAQGYILPPDRREGYERMLRDLPEPPDRIAHFWLVTKAETFRPGGSFDNRNTEHGFWSLFFLGQVLGAENLAPHIAVFTTDAEKYPEKALIHGPAKVIPKEVPGLTVATADITLTTPIEMVVEEMLADRANLTAMLRGERRYERVLKPVALPDVALPEHGYDVPEGAVVLITGGTGGIGLTLAADLVRRKGAKVMLVSRKARGAANVEVFAADVCNIDDMRRAVDHTMRTLGPVQVVIHAAGMVDDEPLLSRDPAAADAVLAPKVLGAQVLGRLFPEGSIEKMVLFASTSTVIGAAGQVDYVAANAYLNAFAGTRGDTVALNWGIWSGVGMVVGRVGSPMLESVSGTEGSRLFTANYDASRWILDEHRTSAGQALIPGTGWLELAAEAMRHEGVHAFEIRNLTFLRPLEVPDGSTRAMRARLSRQGAGHLLEVRSAVDHEGRIGWQMNLQATLGAIGTAGRIDIAGIEARCRTPVGLTSPQEAHLAFGPRWRVLRRGAFGTGEGIAELALPPEYAAEVADWPVHPALMDIATGWAIAMMPSYDPAHLWVPVSYARVAIHAPVPAQVFSWVRAVHANGSFDITIADGDGNVVVEVDGFAMRRLENGLASPPPDARELEFDTHQPEGIRPTEGPEAFRRALACGLGQVYVSSQDLPYLVRQAQVSVVQGQTFARPDLDSAYVEPRNDVEKRLVGFWQDLLGVAQVGVEDDFFALGGHSLIAVRLFAMIKKAFAAEFPISVLFEAPTIAACAAMIERRIGPQAQPVVPQFRYLVPMANGVGTPIFVLAGMGGNILNLRGMAQLLGRPFWGVQARGLFGEDEPHDDLTEAAHDFLAEIRQVQPHGPYLLAGFSGGGLTAWEMARILEEAGEEVALTVLLDTPMPLRPPLTKIDKALIKLTEFRRKGPGYFHEWMQSRRDYAAERAREKVQDANAFHYAALEVGFRAALAHFALVRRSGRAVLFRPPLDHHWPSVSGRWVSREREYVYADNDWTQFAPELEVIEVPGNHHTMVLEPNVRVLAARLREILAGIDDAPLAEAAE